MKKSVRLLSLFLMILMILTSLPLTALAAGKEVYLSEVRISTASTEAAAKQWLTDNGYTVVDTNLNKNTGKDAVYIGYKTTNDSKKAITDLSLMQMNGGYSLAEYEALLEQKAKEINDILDSLETCILEARRNYTAGKTGAREAAKILNRFLEDDSGLPLGNLIFESAVSREDMIKIFLQGNSDITAMIYNALAMACTLYEEEDNWLNRLSKIDPFAEYDVKLYSDTADYLFDSFVNIHDELVLYEEQYRAEIESLDFDNLEEGTTSLDIIPEGSTISTTLYLLLDLVEYRYKGGETLRDFFLRDPDELDSEELFPLIAAMSEGQRGIAEFVGFQNLIFYAQSDEEGIEKYATSVINSFISEGIDDELISVYHGVDRSLFEDGGVALSTAALRKSASTGDDSWFSSKNIDPNISRILNTVCALSLGMIVAAPILGKVGKLIAKGFATKVVYNNALVQMCAVYQIPVVSQNAYVQGISNEVYITMQLREGASLEAQKTAQQFFKTASKRIMTGVRVAMGMATAALLIAEAVKIGIKVYNYYHPEYDPIPRAIVDEVITDTESYYINYYAVKDQNGELGDLNAWSGDRWNALYATTDPKAGDPILAASLAVKLNDNNFPSDEHSAIHYFGETAAANVNRYHLRRSATPTYIFYQRDHSLSMTGSAFSGGQLIMFTGFGLLGGLIIGSLGTIKFKKKDGEGSDYPKG